MNYDETASVLALAASYDQRKVGDTDVKAWLRQLADLPAADCAQAVFDHYGESRERVMPVDVLDRVRAYRVARATAVKDEQVIADVHSLSKGYIRILQARRALIRDGATLEDAVGAVRPDPTEEAAAAALEERSLRELGTANPGGLL
jgi:Xaa-Pro aminopeptidase